ncbi:hypothetical protein GN244_ATG10191 [Phytophthora infestans]|uniref:Uncharacterized protein n=1 Tax=Phytophthora infestans TaxID=4787 RepID=A0A833W133_PHYIN|nr:hypothetical protein GN244_ATG10191 [Phytophthora infestans]KAF4134437.1 hypothetical protein GN958_ATG16372 [Phytophthora infestans]
MNDVVAFFAKVEEVRDAVNQLGQGKGPTGRSITPLEVLKSTLQLHQTLDDKLKNLASGIKLVTLNVREQEKNDAKRKREEVDNEEEATSSDSSSSSSSSSSDDDYEEKDSNRHKKQKRLEASKTPSSIIESADQSLAHEALIFFTTLKPGNAEMTHTWTKTLFSLKVLLNHLSALTADKPTIEVTSQALEAAVAAFSNIKWTTEFTKQVQALLAALNDACSKNEALRVSFHRVRAELESLEMNNPRSSFWKETMDSDRERHVVGEAALAIPKMHQPSEASAEKGKVEVRYQRDQFDAGGDGEWPRPRTPS